jgi:hypothetical protein
MSLTPSVQSYKAPTAEPAEPVNEINEYEDAEKNFQQKSLKFWTVIIGVYLSIFIVALVSFAAGSTVCCLHHSSNIQSKSHPPSRSYLPQQFQGLTRQQDRTIIATAIPKITDAFNSIEDIGWYSSAYMLTCACFMPISGRIYQLYSTKWVFLLSILIFEIGSALCGAASSSIAFIIGRAIAGLGSAGIFSGGMMVMLPLVPLRKRPIFTSIFGMAFGISSVLGPIIGGTFTDKV